MAWPTTNDPRVKFATMRMTEAEDDDVDWACRYRGMSRSEYLRLAAAEQIARDKKAARKAGK